MITKASFSNIALDLKSVLISDAQRLSDFVNSVYRGEEATRSWTSEASFIGGQRVDQQMIIDILNDPNQTILQNSDDPLRCCIHLKKDGDIVWLGMITVKLSEQGSGLGKALVSSAERFAKEKWHTKYAKMNVIAFREELISWYERRGYQRTPERAPFPYGDARYGVPMRSDIEFMIMTKDL